MKRSRASFLRSMPFAERHSSRSFEKPKKSPSF
jgi:hypothetical protein